MLHREKENIQSPQILETIWLVSKLAGSFKLPQFKSGRAR